MSPTVLRQDGYIFMIYPNDHTPAHVHVKKAESDARIRLDPVELLHNWGFSNRELQRILEIIQVNQAILLVAWDRIHPDR